MTDPRERAKEKVAKINTSWQARLQEQAYQKMAKDAQSLQGFYEQAALNTPTTTEDEEPWDYKWSTPTGLDLGQSKLQKQVDPSDVGAKDRWQSDFVKAYEAADTSVRGDVSREFWMEFSPEELRVFGEGLFTDEAGLPTHETIAARVENELASYDMRRSMEQREEDMFQAEVERLQGHSISPMIRFIPVLGDVVGIYQSADRLLTGEAEVREFSATEEAEIRLDIHKTVWGEHDKDYDDEIEHYLDDEMGFLSMIADGLEAPAGISPGQSREGITLPSGTELELTQFKAAWDAESNLLWEMGIRGRADLTPEKMTEIRAQREVMLRNQINAMPKDSEKLLHFARNPGTGEWFGDAFGSLMDKGFDFAGVVVDKGGVVTAPFKYATLPILEWVAEKIGTDTAESMAAMRAESGDVDSVVLAEALFKNAEQSWNDFEENEPQVIEEYMSMGMGDISMAKSLFQADMTASLEPAEQVTFLDDIREQDMAFIEEAADADFTTGTRILELLGNYNRLGPMRLATYSTLLLTDEDFYNQATTNQWSSFFSDLETKAQVNDYSPAQVMDMDGSLAGLLLDLGGGILFDPLTWIFAPAGAARGGASQTARAAEAFRKSAYAERTLKDIVRFSQDPAKGANAMWNITSWMDPVSRRAMLHKIGWNPKTIPGGAWRGQANRATVMRRDILDELLSPEDIRGISVDEVDSLRTSIAKDGFDEALEVTISRADGNIWVSDGAKRLLASDDLSHVPVRLRITDSVAPSATGRIKVPGWADDSISTMQTVRKAEITFKEGATNEAARRSFLEAAQKNILDPDYLPTGSVTTRAGEQLEVKVLRQANRPNEAEFIAVNSQGEAVAVIDTTTEGSGFAVATAYSGKGAGKELIHQMLDLAHTQGADLISGMKLTTLSRAGKSTLDDYIDNVVSNALPEGNRAGRHIDDMLEEGEALGKPFKDADGVQPDVFQRPDAILPFRMLHGDVPLDDIMEIMVQSVKNGAVQNSGQYAAIAARSGMALRKLMKSNAPGRWLERYTGAFSNVRHRAVVGAEATDDLIEDMYRMFGDDTASLNQHMDRIFALEAEMEVRNTAYLGRLAELQPRQERLVAMLDKLGKGRYEKVVGESSERSALRAIAAAEDMELRRLVAKIDAETGVISHADELEKITREVWDDFNRKHIATNSQWKDLVDPETGMVPWKELGKGKMDPVADVLPGAEKAIPESVQAVAKDLGIDAEALMQKLSHGQNAKLSMDVPASPLEMIMASSTGGAAYTRATHWGFIANARESALTLHRMWTIDKVFTLSTAATVSFDELLRIFHRYGIKSMTRWARDRVMFMDARRQALQHGKGISRSKGAPYLSPKRQERMRTLYDYGQRMKNVERQGFDQNGVGWQDMLPGESGYDDAARAWSGGMVQDSGFRAFLRGPEDFRTWFFGPDGERLRKGTVMQFEGGEAKTLLVQEADEYYKGWKALFDDVILQPARKAGTYDEVRQAWLDTALKVDAAGGITKDLPDIAIRHMGAVRGIKKDAGMRLGVKNLTETMFEKMFQDPINYRRGFLADLTRTHEKARLINLMNSQGKRIVTDIELEGLLGLQGMAGATRTGLQSSVHEMALKAGYVPESYLDNMVEKAVRREIEHTLYQFDVGSRLGSQARAAFPFAKPWADMAAFWGKETIRKPVLRGWINEKNALGLRTLNEKGLLSFPVPNRAAGMISRFANTDFEIDRGLIGGQGEGIMHEGGLIPGSESTNFSPLFFLPTEGDNPFQYMLPGVGILPVAFLDMYMSTRYDPVTQPEEYQKLKDEIGQVIPTVQYQQGGGLSRILGGGTISKLTGMATDITGLVGHNSYFNVTSAMGDISREIDRTRSVSALLADPAELEMLLEAETADEAEELLEALAVQADVNAGQAHLAETALRFMAPVGSDFSSSLGEIENVWLDAAAFPELAHILEGDPESMTDEQRRQVAGDLRKEFFALEDWQRDAMVVQQPSLAVNMVGSWEWTPDATGQGIEGSDHAYRTGGSKEELARHESLVNRGLVRPVQPIVRARRIIGVVDAARKDAAKTLYENQVNRVNDILWAVAQEDPKVTALLQIIIDSDFGERYNLLTLEDAWRNWSRIEEDVEFYVAEEAGIDPTRGVSTRKDDLTAFDNLRKAISIDSNLKPWGASFPGLDEEGLSSRFADFPVLAPDEQAQTLADALGIEFQDGMLGGELYEEVQQIIVQQRHPIYDVVRPDYDRYIGDRSSSSGRNMMYELAQSGLISEDMQQSVHEFLFVDDMMKLRRTEDRRNGLSLADQQRMRDDFLYIMHGSKDQRTDWNGIWEEQYQRVYGPLDWTAPEPVAPVDADGNLVGTAVVPSIREIVDGDTILTADHPGSAVLTSYRLLGIRAPEMGGPEREAALDAEEALKTAILRGVENGDRIYLVRDERFGNTDHYGRVLAWLWIGDTPYYNEEDLRPHQDPSGSN